MASSSSAASVPFGGGGTSHEEDSEAANWERVRGEDDEGKDISSDWEDEELYLSDGWELENEEGRGTGAGRGGKKSALRVGVGTALLLGASVGIGVGVSVAALAAVAARQVSKKEEPWTLADAFSGRLPFQSKGRKARARRPSLSAESWCSACDERGRLARFDKVLEHVSQGGVTSTIRAIVWPFLAGLEDAEGSAQQRAAHFEVLRRRYASLLDACRSLQQQISEPEFADEPRQGFGRPQAEEYRENKRIIKLDVVRTDLGKGCFELPGVLAANLQQEAMALGISDHIENAEYLTAVQKDYAKYMAKLLLCYAIHDPQTGYCQGMTDLVQPFIETFTDEAMAFWCFASFMEQARTHFRTDERGILAKIDQVRRVVGALDAPLLARLEAIGAGSCHFAYRMLLVYLRREMSLEHSKAFLEVMWAQDLRELRRGAGGPGFLVFAVAGVVLDHAQQIHQACQGEADIMQLFCKLDLSTWGAVEVGEECRARWLQLQEGGS